MNSPLPGNRQAGFRKKAEKTPGRTFLQKKSQFSSAPSLHD
jgi:hypothetical protein